MNKLRLTTIIVVAFFLTANAFASAKTEPTVAKAITAIASSDILLVTAMHKVLLFVVVVFVMVMAGCGGGGGSAYTSSRDAAATATDSAGYDRPPAPPEY